MKNETPADETLATVVALVRADRRPGHRIAEDLEGGTPPRALLERALAGAADRGQQSLLITPEGLGEVVAHARAELAAWRTEGINVCSVLDPAYPSTLREVHDRPPLLFAAGRMRPGSDPAIAVIGSRSASAAGLKRASDVARHLVDRDFVVVSGLATGVDRAAHVAALKHDGRTIAVIGTGLRHSYPRENADLQSLIATSDVVVSPFWPDTTASRETFPIRNGVMSGLSLASVIVEAGVTSGARIQARLALAHGRPVFLAETLISQSWAQTLAARPAVHVYREPAEITEVIERRIEPRGLIA